MKHSILLLFVFILCSAKAQWISKKIDNGFDEPYKFAYSAEPKDRFIKLQPYDDFDTKILFYLGGEYYCGDGPVFIELSFQVNGQNKKYSRYCNLFNIDEDKYAMISDDFMNEAFLSDFKASSTMKIRINDYDCESQDNFQTVYTFSMSGSSAALNFVLKP